ncbi:hypothetical protein HPB50_015345 [Hyalomma asiaticum]|uniref:Uncharacterized protein n=1 Tax=Hyalomma asiaticum TaxID=266040 RepID=A0ACB7SYK1_HYAAI|nr:hypothetical protein HPB50_015345 [Hyalomma asiaticum]
MQSAIETLHATVLGLANRTANLEENMQMTMNHPVFTMHGRVPASSDAGPSNHQGQPTLKTAGSRSLIAGGDFNAADTAWGYGYSTAKGRQLGQDAQELDFTLITDPAYPTRIGNYTSRDRTPDLTFVRNTCPADTTWKNTSADLGSDHMIVEVCVSTPDRVQGSKRKHEWTDWEDFRKKLTTCTMSNAHFSKHVCGCLRRGQRGIVRKGMGEDRRIYWMAKVTARISPEPVAEDGEEIEAALTIS